MINIFYKKASISHVAVLDQINHAVSFIRRWNQFVKENQQLIDDANNKRQVIKAEWARINQAFNPTAQLISLARQFTAINPFHYILNSSVNIERELLEEQNIKDGKLIQEDAKMYKPLTFELKCKNKNHSPMKITSLQFQKNFKTQSGKIRFWQFFLDLLEEKKQSQNLKEQEWKNFKDAFLQYACSFNLKDYYRFLHIRLFFQTYKISNNDIFRRSDIDRAIRDIIFDFEEKSLDYFTENLQKFMQKGDIEFKKKIIQGIYDYANQLTGKKLDKIVLDFQVIGMITGNNKLAQRDKLIAFLQSSNHNKQPIPVQNMKDSSKVEILWSPQNFIDIAKPIVSPRSYKNQINLPPFLKRGIQRNPALRGGKVQSLIQNLLTSGAVFTFRNVRVIRMLKANSKSQKKRTDLNFQQEKIQIKDKETFIALNSRSLQRQSFQQYFQSVLIKCQKNIGSWIAAVPVKGDQKNDEDIVYNNPSVDFAIVKCNINQNNEKEFIINTYDATIGYTSLSQKEQNAKALLLEKATVFKRKVQVRHHILCFDKHCRNPLPVTKETSIYYSSIKDMEITETPTMRKDKKFYEEVINVVIEEYKKYLKT